MAPSFGRLLILEIPPEDAGGVIVQPVSSKATAVRLQRLINYMKNNPKSKRAETVKSKKSQRQMAGFFFAFSF